MSPSACSTDARQPEPTVSPDGGRTAFVVSTIELEKNTAASRVWLTSAAGPAGHQRRPRRRPGLVARWSLAFTSRRGEKEHETTLHVLPVDGPGEVRTVATLPDGVANVAWSPNGQWLAFTSRTRDPATRPRTSARRRHARSSGSSAASTTRWIVDRPEHVYVVAADGTGAVRNLTPGPFQHDGVSWLRFVVGGHVGATP